MTYCCLDCEAEFEYVTEWRAHGRDTGHELLNRDDYDDSHDDADRLYEAREWSHLR